MSPLGWIFLLHVGAAEGCVDVYDRTPQCAALSEEAPVVPVEPSPIAPPSGGGGSALGLGGSLLLGAGAVSVLGIALQGTSLWFRSQMDVFAVAPGLPPAELAPFLRRQALAGDLALGALVAGGLLAGSGLAFLVFDPSSGQLRWSFLEDEG